MNNSGVPNSVNIDKDAWIICDSRSHPGLKFYVNKVTGIKVWNITDAEIALAEKVGKVGPEPDGFPKMNNPTDQSANIYNQQIIDNQFSNQLSNLVLTAAGNAYPNWDNHQGQPVNLQQQLFNSQGLPVNLQQQLFTLVPTAALTPLINQAASLQNYHQLLAQTTTLHNNVPFIPQQKQYGQNQRTPIKRSFNSLNNQINDWNEEQYHRQERQFNPTNGSDLRTKLTKRRRSCSGSFIINDVDFQYEKTKKSTKHEMKNKVESVSSLKLQPLKLTPLKTLTATNFESNQWFIVVEKDIILENYTFLDDLVTADPDCHLVVPHHVILELRTHVSVSSDVRPRRTLRFLTQQIENGMAMLGEQEEGHNSSHNTILTCMKLATRNNVVILITNNKETLTFKPNTNGIHVFTMRAVKNILETKSTKPRPSSPTMAIKIVVPNNFNKKKKTSEPDNNISRQLFNHNGYYDQSRSNNDNLFHKDKEIHEPENNIPRELFNHYGYYDQSSSNNENLYTPPATKNGKIVHIIDKHPKPPTPSVSTIISPGPETKKISLERIRSTPETNSLNISKVDDKNPHKPAMTNKSPNVQEITTQRTPDNNSPSSCKIDENNLHKQASPLISPTPTTKAVPCNNNAVDEVDALCRRGSATYIAPIDPNNSNFHHTSDIKKPDSNSTSTPKKYSPTKPEFASPRKIYNANWNHTGHKNMHDTMDTSSTSSTSNISLDSISIKKIISMKKLVTASSKGQIERNHAKEITPLTARPKSPSSWASYDNDNTSEWSLKNTANKNLVIEETSTSEVISNSESFNSDVVKTPKKQDGRKVSRRRRVVMYEVACQSMEEVLRLRSEEWVFRFVQIMEEVLRVKLQEKIPYEQKEPAPWNLQEAARCIIKKFDNHFDVVDAANKLARFLYETSDENGKIINIEPSDYMELYSYGVFLVETFLDMCTDCKEKDCRTKKNDKRDISEEICSCHEVGTASELLKKLLFDIHNANVETFVDQEIDHRTDFLMDSSVGDSTEYDFNLKTKKRGSTEVDKMKMNEIENAENLNRRYPIRRKQPETLDEVTPNAKKPKASSNCSQFTIKDKATKADEGPRKVQTKVKSGKRFEKIFFDCLQLSKKVDQNKKNNGLRKKADVEVPPKYRTITMGTSSDSAFFSSLQLDKKDLNNADKLKACKITVVCSNKPDAPDEQNDPSRSSPEELKGLKCHFSNENNLLEKSPSKVVCTFKINEDIERRVKAKWYQKEYENPEPEDNMNEEHNETQDSIRSVDNTLDEVGKAANENFKTIPGMAANESFKTIPVEDNLYERTTNKNHLSIDEKVHDKIIEAEANAIFQDEIKHISVKLVKVFSRVTLLIDTYYKEKMQSAKCKEELHCKVKIALMLLFRIHKVLESAKKRENHYEYKLKKLLKLEKPEHYFTDDRFSSQFRHFITKCVKASDEILKNLREMSDE